MFGIDAISSYLMVIALLILLLAVLVWQRQRTGKTILVWLAAGAVGVLLGSIGSYAAVRLGGYTVEKVYARGEDVTGEAEDEESDYPEEGSEGGESGSGGGPPGAGGGMFGGPRQPRPKRDLTTLVRKLELLTGDIAIKLTDEQAASLGKCLADLEKAETMSDDEAKAKHEEVLALLDDQQKSRLEAIGLPRPARRGGPGGPGAGGPGGPGQDEQANPFQEETSAKALAGLRQRLGP